MEKLTAEQIDMLNRSKEDIKKGRLISQEAMDTRNSERSKPLVKQ